MPGHLAIIAEFKCQQCGERFKACACESSGWIVTCPNGHAFTADGGTRADAPRSSLTDNRVFTGTETLSRVWGFHPDEVREVGAMLGPRAANCINANGDVNFQDRSEERHFRERYKATRASNEGRVRESEQAHGASGTDDE
jgi:hypothetical protein